MTALEGVVEPKKKSTFSLVIKTKLVQNVNRMSERQNDMPKDRLTDRQTDRRQNDFSA